MTVTNLIIDTDFHLLADDHEALVLIARRCAAGEIDLLGVTTVTGNTWARTGTAHASQAVAALGLDAVPVVEGAGQPLLHRQSDFTHRSRLYGAAFGGAWGKADLLEKQPGPQPVPNGDQGHAVTFIIDTLRHCRGPVTLLAIGPLTNIALAIRLAPDICQRIDRIVCMGGAFFVTGNVTPSAEFNWWFDPEAAAIVLEQDVDLVVVPLDATDRIVLDHARFTEWSRRFGEHRLFREFHAPKFGPVFERDASFRLPTWDAIAAACLIDGELVRRIENLWVSVDCSDGPSYGRVVAYPDAEEFNLPQPARRRAQVVLEIDAAGFWQLYETHMFATESPR